eukprot:GILK01002039.1.p1 GENE.GILK01002039.1~~GILK01002039.1.p1  ORF type:complete len:477 (+),score=71.87 GILK01002039.1:47-1432(+)
MADSRDGQENSAKENGVPENGIHTNGAETPAPTTEGVRTVKKSMTGFQLTVTESGPQNLLQLLGHSEDGTREDERKTSFDLPTSLKFMINHDEYEEDMNDDSSSDSGESDFISSPPEAQEEPYLQSRSTSKWSWQGEALNDSEADGQLRVFCVTWNMHAKPGPDDLTSLLRVNIPHHLYVIGTEECERSIEASIVFQSKAKWEAKLQAALGDGYTLLRAHTLQAIHLCIFIRSDLVSSLHDVESAHVATGLGNVLGNKGGIGISFTIHHTSYLFINCHLAAHQGNVKQRNAEFHKINAELSLGKSNKTFPNVSDRFDHVVWMGDLNYRINGNRKAVNALIHQSMHEVLLANDQLLRERKHGNVFSSFQEGHIDFPPTYKFDRNSDIYDSSKKSRIPSWTDRILYKGSKVAQETYGWISDIRTSDHRPVFAQFTMPFDVKIKRQNLKPAVSKSVKSKVCAVM